MADNLSKEQRSYAMSRIRSAADATTELALIGLFKSAKVTGWRRNYCLPGKPDFGFCQRRVAVFVDGCFWHGCRRCYSPPKSNVEYWAKKIAGNMSRDKVVNGLLRSRGWTVLRIKEHTLRMNPHYVTRRIKEFLQPD